MEESGGSSILSRSHILHALNEPEENIQAIILK